MEAYSSLKDLNLEQKVFASKDEVKPWLSTNLFHSKGIKIIIERSDFHKIIFRCQHTRQKEISHGQRRRHITCPFKVRANYSSRTKTWSLTVLNEFHNHSIPETIKSTSFTDKPDSLSDVNFSVDIRNDVGTDMLKGEGSPKGLNFLNPEEHSDQSEHHLQEQPQHQGSQRQPRRESSGMTEPSTSSRSTVDTRTTNKVNKPKSKRQRRSKPKEDKTTPQLFDLLNEEYKDFELADDLGKKINQLINSKVTMNQQLDEESKSNIIRLVINNLVQEHKEETADTKLNTWFSSPTSTTHANANLIPLSPLLNDSEADYPATGALNGTLTGNQGSLESLTLPGINTNIINTHSTNNLNNFVIPNQLQINQIQNQNKQLPSFNSIQNNLPPSPGSMNMYNTLPNPGNTLNPTLLNSNKLVGHNPNSNTHSSSNNSFNNMNTNNYTTTVNNNINSLLFDSKDKPNSFLTSLSTLLTNNVASPTNVVKSSFTHDHSFKIRNESDNE